MNGGMSVNSSWLWWWWWYDGDDIKNDDDDDDDNYHGVHRYDNRVVGGDCDSDGNDYDEAYDCDMLAMRMMMTMIWWWWWWWLWW